jgi:hypothetical protein
LLAGKSAVRECILEVKVGCGKQFHGEPPKSIIGIQNPSSMPKTAHCQQQITCPVLGK